MTHTRRLFISAPATLALASVALAADPPAGEGGSQAATTNPLLFDLLQFGAAIGVFLAALIILSKLVWPKITAALDAREAKILSEIENAERARAEAEQAQRQYGEELAQARAEATKMIEAAKADASRAAAELKAQNEAEIGQMRDSARAAIAAAQKAAVAELYAQAGSLATAVAEKILQREVNEHDQQRLVDETLAEISHEFASAQQPAGSHA